MKKLKYVTAIIMISVFMSGCGDVTPAIKESASTGQTGKVESSVTDATKDSTSTDNSTTDNSTADNSSTTDSSSTADSSSANTTPTDTQAPTEAPVVLEKIKFNPHVYVPMLAEIYPQEWWDSLYSFCDAIREGKDTFECASQEIYDWCTDITTLAQLFPAAGGKISGKSNDGTVPFENGTGRIYYQIPVEDMVKREAEFEAVIEDILNNVLESDDTDFEKAFKLYDYIAANYTYTEGFVSDGAFSYSSLMEKKGVCDHIASNYAYLLLQAGVDAVEVGCSGGLDHAWNYVKIDGEGYHCDATWALHNEDVALPLWHFMNSAEYRAYHDVPLDTLEMPLLPEFFLSKTDYKLPADSEKFRCFDNSEFVSLDEERKVLCYKDDVGEHELYYEE